MKTQMIAVDLDGTLLNSKGELTPYTIETLQKVSQKGYIVIIATGRPYRMTQKFYQQLQLQTPMLNFNGSFVHIPHQKWKWEKSYCIDKSYLFEFLRLHDDIEADFIASEYKQKFFITPHHLQQVSPQLMGVQQITSQHWLQADKITANPYSILLQTRHSNKYELTNTLRQHFQHEIEINTWGGPLNILETCAKGISKASALSYLLEQYQIPAQHLMVFGDEQNDIKMFQLAGTSYAMKNANNLLLPYASHITAFSNDEDGVAKELERLLL